MKHTSGPYLTNRGKKMLLYDLTHEVEKNLSCLRLTIQAPENAREWAARQYLMNELSAILLDIRRGKIEGAQRKFEKAVTKADNMRQDNWSAALEMQTELWIEPGTQLAMM